jgi:Mrp family chromosome partitioning ATPase
MVLLVALFLGALLPAGILYLLQMFKQTVDTRAELESLTRLPIIGEIPSTNPDDALRTLRTNLLLNLKAPQKTILVTSATPAAGKTFLAQHLAATLTAIGKKALYINADLRNPSVSSVLMSKDNSSLLTLNSSLQSSHPADILASADFAQQLKAAQASNDYVILDSPALGEYTDAYQLASFADATLYIVHSGKTPKSAISSLNTDKNLPNICLVLNEVK